MRRLIQVALASTLVLGAGAAHAAPGPIVPITVVSPATVLVSLQGALAPPLTVTGTLPISFPFNLSGPGCSAAGTVNASVVNGGIEVRASQGALSGGGCAVGFSLTKESGALFELTIPDISESITPVFFSVVQSGEVTGGVVMAPELSIGEVIAFLSRLVGPVTIGLPGFGVEGIGMDGDRASMLVHFLPTDIVSIPHPSLNAAYFSMAGNVSNPGASGTFDYTMRFEAFLPPNTSPPIAAPAFNNVGRGFLGAALIGIVGIVFSRRAARAIKAGSS